MSDLTTFKDESLANQYAKTLKELIELKIFLASAPANWDRSQNKKPFKLPSDEIVHCVYWNNVFYITGTDIVRCLTYRFQAFGRNVVNKKKFEEGIFSDLRNLKCDTDAILEEPKSPFLDFLYRNNCVRTQKKQKVFHWYSVGHDRLFLDALERDLKKESLGRMASTQAVNEPALSFRYDSQQSLHDQLAEIIEGIPKPLAMIADASTSAIVSVQDANIISSMNGGGPIPPQGGAMMYHHHHHPHAHPGHHHHHLASSPGPAYVPPSSVPQQLPIYLQSQPLPINVPMQPQYVTVQQQQQPQQIQYAPLPSLPQHSAQKIIPVKQEQPPLQQQQGLESDFPLDYMPPATGPLNMGMDYGLAVPVTVPEYEYVIEQPDTTTSAQPAEMFTEAYWYDNLEPTTSNLDATIATTTNVTSTATAATTAYEQPVVTTAAPVVISNKTVRNGSNSSNSSSSSAKPIKPNTQRSRINKQAFSTPTGASMSQRIEKFEKTFMPTPSESGSEMGGTIHTSLHSEDHKSHILRQFVQNNNASAASTPVTASGAPVVSDMTYLFNDANTSVSLDEDWGY
ncbi:hypothetical protein TRVA0_004S01640 [Trichomonascus vanleenenianus]|uniref:STE domain-containing protein n=1 Tax=Trichomonascus vanleenenianus TaxID=2268995 RepID=UPI003ECA0AE0